VTLLVYSADISKKVSRESREIRMIDCPIKSIHSAPTHRRTVMLYTGIDLHRRSMTVCTVNGTGSIVERQTMKTRPELVTAYFRQWSTDDEQHHHAVVECTTGWYWLCDLLRSLGVTVVLAHAKYLKAISYAKVKTDAVDAQTLAQLLRMGYVPEAHQLPPEYRAMRDLLRQRMVMEHKRKNIIQRIASILAQFNITSVACSPSAPGFATFLERCALPTEYRMSLLMYHVQCLQTTEHRRQLEKYFKARLRPTPTLQLLMSIPGLGEITGAIIAMETGDIHRFADAKHYCSYCRLVPGAKDSGSKHSHRSGSKDGNQYLKYAFTETAIKAMLYYPEIKAFAARLEEHAGKAIARTVVAKELAKIVYYVLTRHQEFKTFKGITIEKLRDWPRARKPVRITEEESTPAAMSVA
jgi:transposase